jgi:phosphoribosyl-ATP pyrophosphohydrolase/phosphoribosyl-AMP cyclohydrolase/histidinol dehydrogenase
MTAVTARAAGVPTVILASPRPTPHLLAAAHLAGVDAMLALGGVQAIAAMMLGLFDLPAADMIVGPGNRWVTAAKHLVSHRVGIDMLAGPSELLVLADESADPGVVAADLLAQAEHDDDAVPMLVTWHGPLAEAVNRELDEQLKTLPTATTARKALENGWICIARDEDQALALVDCVAPEHLEILTRDARRHAAGVRNAGAIFIGAGAAEVLGDYGAGPNHTLPTAGAARFRAGLSVFAFLRARTWMEMDAASAWAPLAREAAAFARLEGLEAHARAAERRL